MEFQDCDTPQRAVAATRDFRQAAATTRVIRRVASQIALM
jgi:hypothetical protein